MAEIVNLSVFTNEGVACTSADLLQQAFQDVVSDGDRDNEIVAFFEDDGGQHQTIRLTQEQAAALGLTFEVDSCTDNKTSELTYSQTEENILDDIQGVTSNETTGEEPQTIDQIEFPGGSEWIQDADDLGDIADDNGPTIDIENDPLEHEMSEFEDDVQNRSVRAFVLQHVQNLKVMNKKIMPEVQSHQQTTTPIQRAPVILPQSQYIIKSPPTVLKTAKNVRLLSHINKPSISHASGLTNVLQSSLFMNPIQKLSSTNGLNPQFITGNSVSVANGPNGEIRLSPVVKTPQNIQRGNQQFYTSVSKAAEPLRSIKSQVSNGKGNGSLIKSVPVATQMVRTSAPTVKIPSNLTRAANSQMIFKKTTARLNTQDLKPVVNNNGIVRPQNQLSILKPQAKVRLTNGNKHNGIVQTSKLVKKVSISPQRSSVDRRIVQNYPNPINLQNNLPSTVVKGFKKSPEVSQQQNPLLVAPAPPVQSEVKSVNGADNPIQIVQQGNTFHSNQKLTQTQLKQIAHVLQQRGHQESAASKEKVVYRVVFPEELDLRIRNPNNLLKGGRGKRGRPKKAPGRHVAAVRAGMTDEETEESKEDRKKVVARTRSGRLSRPPRHMVRDYKHLHPLDFMQPDLDDSDGGYSDYNTNTILNNKLEGEGNKELLKGLEVPKRKVSTHFRCSTCNKIYLGRARLAKHFEVFPDHGSIELQPSSTLTSNSCAEGELKKSTPITGDSFKRKGKKRGPWAYVTPEAKSERRQTKLREALSVCDSGEISKIAAKPVLNAQSLYDLMAIKSDNNVKIFLNELKVFMEQIRQQAGVMLSPIIDTQKEQNLIELRDELLCDALGLVPGVYSINDDVFTKPEIYDNLDTTAAEEPPIKLQKLRNEEGKENIEERLSSGFSESSDLSVSDFLAERKPDSNCPEVLTALTLMPRNSSPVAETIKSNVSKLLISSPQIQRQISDNPGFQKVDINGSKSPTFKKLESLKEGFTKLTAALDLPTCSPVFPKLEGNYEHQRLECSSQMFIKLEPMQQNFIKLENGTVGTYTKVDTQHLNKLENCFHSLGDGGHNFTKGFQKIISKIAPMSSEIDCQKPDGLNSGKSTCKIIESLPMLQDTGPIITTTCDTSIFGNSDNLDPIGHLDYSAVMDKHLMMDEKLVEQLHLVDQSNLVDELVSERLKNIIPDNILDNNLMPNTTNLDTELDFEALSEEFNRNTRS